MKHSISICSIKIFRNIKDNNLVFLHAQDVYRHLPAQSNASTQKLYKYYRTKSIPSVTCSEFHHLNRLQATELSRHSVTYSTIDISGILSQRQHRFARIQNTKSILHLNTKQSHHLNSNLQTMTRCHACVCMCVCVGV